MNRKQGKYHYWRHLNAHSIMSEAVNNGRELLRSSVMKIIAKEKMPVSVVNHLDGTYINLTHAMYEASWKQFSKKYATCFVHSNAREDITVDKLRSISTPCDILE